MIKAIVTDIEGTTSSIAFVKDVLFPYASAHIAEFVVAHQSEPAVAACVAEVVESAHLPDDASITMVIAQLQQWTVDDVKATPLKTLQGMLWKAGYEAGDYQAHVYPDAFECLTRWSEALPIFVYSSGSVQAQQLFFQYSQYDDMRGLFSGYFDTTTGSKKSEASYRAIAQAIDCAPESVLFLSDIDAEIIAAKQAGMQTCWLVRDGHAVQGADTAVAADFHDVARQFAIG